MNGRPLTDVQIAQALRAHLPEAASPGLRERIFDEARTTAQLRSIPSFLGVLGDPDPAARRRTLLIAAAMLLALALASAAAVGAWRLLQRDPFRDLSLEPPSDVQAFVLSSRERLPELPPVALTWRDSDSAKGRIYVDRSGAVRFDRFASADATEPAGYRILSPDHRISGMATVDDEAVWIEPGHEAIGDDPRAFLGTILGVDDGPGCEIERDSSEGGNDSAAAAWRYVGLEYVAGRPTHHVACAGDLWIDIETRLILRTREPRTDDAGQPLPGQFETTEVTEIAFAEQPAALFEPPPGLARISEEEYSAYICARDLPNELAPGISDCPSSDVADATPPPEPSIRPTPSAAPGPSDCVGPAGAPGERIGPLAWTPESLDKDWPAPVRPEPARGGSIRPMPFTYLDPVGDNGSSAYACVDIQGVSADTSEVHLKLESSPPAQGPAEIWIAYGVVTDDDRDGVPDWRYGIDNSPFGTAEAPGDPAPSRWWRTDLHTGRTYAGGMDVRGSAGWLGADFKSEYPRIGSDASFVFSGALETTTGSVGWGTELAMPFYAWASVIVNGRVVATDYAPDAGWLVASRGMTPGGTFLLGDPFPELSMAVPEGWTVSSTAARETRIGVAGVLRRVKCLPGDFARDEAYSAHCALVRFEVIDNPEELCVDPIEPPADVTVDGYRGTHLEYSPVEADGACDFAEDVWILDVDGVRLMILSVPIGDLEPDVGKEAVKAEIRQMVASIQFER